MPTSSPPDKAILVYFTGSAVWLLIPKRRGTGFLKVPLGHHVNSLGTFLSSLPCGDCFGLDGMLEIELQNPANAAADVIDPLSKHLGFPWREVTHTEFFEQHPIKTDPTQWPGLIDRGNHDKTEKCSQRLMKRLQR